MSRFHTDPWVNIVDPGDETVPVRKMNWRAFRALIFRERRLSSLELIDKMCHLLSFCDVLNSEAHIYGLWITFNKNDTLNKNRQTCVNLKLIISLSHYMSNTTLESTLQKIETFENEKLYFLIQIFEENAFDKGPLLTLRCDRYGEYGELVWLQKGNLISGETMLLLCNQFIDYLHIKSCYLMDSAQVTLINDKLQTKNKKKKAYLRLIHILSSFENGLTWYESKGNFKRIKINKWPLIPTRNTRHKNKNANKINVISQDINIYEKSINYVRKFKLNEISKFLTENNKIIFNNIINYHKQYTFDYDVKMIIKKQTQNIKLEQKQQRYSKNRSRSRSRSRTRVRHNPKIETCELESSLSLITVHDLIRRVHTCCLYAPTKWRQLIGMRHLRILYDIIIDPSIILKTKHNAFLLYINGRKYLQCLNEITNFRVFCRGFHGTDRINGIIKAKNVSKYQINKFLQDFEESISVYKEERDINRKRYEDIIDGFDGFEEEENEIRLSLNIKHNHNNNGGKNCKNRKYKHEILMKSNTNNNQHEIEITVKSKSSKKRKSRKRSHSLKSKYYNNNNSDDDDDDDVDMDSEY